MLAAWMGSSCRGNGSSGAREVRSSGVIKSILRLSGVLQKHHKLEQLLFGQSWLTSTNVIPFELMPFAILWFASESCYDYVMPLADSADVGMKPGVQRQCYCWFPPSLRGNLFQMAGTFSTTEAWRAGGRETHEERSGGSLHGIQNKESKGEEKWSKFDHSRN